MSFFYYVKSHTDIPLSAQKFVVLLIYIDTNTLGSSSESIVKGKVTFQDIIFVGKPGSENVPFIVTTNAISNSIMLKQFGKT